MSRRQRRQNGRRLDGSSRVEICETTGKRRLRSWQHANADKMAQLRRVGPPAPGYTTDVFICDYCGDFYVGSRPDNGKVSRRLGRLDGRKGA